MFSKSLLRHCTTSPPPKGIITTNIVGGLGNQLFLIANLLATANRNNLVPYLPIQELSQSSSVFEPRPTYWNSSLLDETLLPAIHHSAPEALIAYLIENKNIDPERGDFLSALQQDPEIQKMMGMMTSSSGGNDNKSDNKNMMMIPELGADAKHILISEEEHLSKSKHFNLVGFFQSDRYFDDFTSSIVPILQPPNLEKQAKESLISGLDYYDHHHHHQHIIGLHVRRGDYLKLTETFEILDADGYYFEAMEKLFGTMLFSRKFGFSSSASSSSSSSSSFFGNQSGCHSPLFRVLIFSEDLEFAKILRGALEVKYPTVQASIVVSSNNNRQNEKDGFVSFSFDENNNTTSNENSNNSQTIPTSIPQDVKELLFMSQCDDLIIANSSFSWWGGYFAKFNDSKRRVVAPQKWFTGKSFVDQIHIYPPEWIVV